PIAGEEFVRSFGGAKQRPLKGIGFWGEDVICDAHRSIIFRSLPPLTLKNGIQVPVRVAFRRLYCDGLTLGKFELVFTTIGYYLCGWEDIRNFVYQVMGLPVRVAACHGADFTPLGDIGRQLLEGYRSATTRVAFLARKPASLMPVRLSDW